MNASDGVDDEVFRTKIQEDRGSYFVEYQPAQIALPFATIQLVFPEVFDIKTVRQAMEDELRHWLGRYAVPVMVSSFDAKGDLIGGIGESAEPHLMGYLESGSGSLFVRWGLLKNEEMPAEQMAKDYLARVYCDVPYRAREEVRRNALRDAKARGAATRLIVLLVIGFPVLIELVSLGVAWLGHVMAAISILVGLRKLGRAMGWLKRSEKEKTEAEKQLKMNHYFYHCERNIETFHRLKAENFERDAVEETRKEAEAIRKRESAR